MNKYPDYVNKFRPKGTIIKKVNNIYYVYEATSKRVEGKKYPVQIVKGVIGKIDEHGFHRTEKVMLEDEAIIKECGFTNFILLHKEILVNDVNLQFKKKDREIILNSMICYLSNNSYLLSDDKNIIYTIEELMDKYKIILGKQISAIERVIERKLNEIEELKYICRVYMGNKEIKSKLNERQKEIIKKIGIDEDGIR